VRGTRVIAITAITLLVVLIACVVGIVVSSSSPTAIEPTHLQVGAGPPSTATALLTFADDNGLSASARWTFDFAHDAADVNASATLSLVTISLEARLLQTILLFDTSSLGSLTGSTWVAVHAPRGPDGMAALANVLRHPDVAALKANAATVTMSDHDTTTTLTFRHVRLPSTEGLPITLPDSGRLVLAITTGPKGQLLGASAQLHGRTDDVHAALVITGYNQPVSIPVPAASDVTPLTRARAQEIFGTNAPAVLRWLARLHLGLGG
jgi:hypothetical protein